MDKQDYQGQEYISMAQGKAEELQAGWKDRISQYPHDKKLKTLGNEIIKTMAEADSTLCNAKLLFKKGLELDKKADKEYDRLKG